MPGPTPTAAQLADAGAIDLSGLAGRIAFSAGPPRGEDVYVIDANGTNLVRVTTSSSTIGSWISQTTRPRDQVLILAR